MVKGEELADRKTEACTCPDVVLSFMASLALWGSPQYEIMCVRDVFLPPA